MLPGELAMCDLMIELASQFKLIWLFLIANSCWISYVLDHPFLCDATEMLAFLDKSKQNWSEIPFPVFYDAWRVNSTGMYFQRKRQPRVPHLGVVAGHLWWGTTELCKDPKDWTCAPVSVLPDRGWWSSSFHSSALNEWLNFVLHGKRW